ncbi:Acg family FMN-binding oxidoreductase [Nocardia sp. NPDC127606]|uniref:Acg family FMN-binding oxidoreductase n=1 Tax=Nocardia sp. NPDC127606 TaxID=3345406 RepID=UPI00363015A9
MTRNSSPDIDTVRTVFGHAARAPSLHNSQPWRWRWDGTTAALYLDAERLLPATDMFNREGVLGAGVMLNHAEVAWGAAGWQTRVSSFPDPTVRGHLASLQPVCPHVPTEPERLLGQAIEQRYSDRMPMDEPSGWQATRQILEFLASRSGTTTTFLDPTALGALHQISAMTTGFRRYDPKYQAELSWWTAGPDAGRAGVPASVLPTTPDRSHIPLGREFPSGTAGPAGEGDDEAMVVVLSTPGDSATDLLDCGRALSAVLLECTVQGLSTCTVSHIVEIPSARARVAELVGQRFPQVLVRIGSARAEPPPRTPRRGLDSFLEIGIADDTIGTTQQDR